MIEKSAFYPIIGKGAKLSLSWPAIPVAPWSAETPNLYTALVKLISPHGNVIERTELKFGFRDIQVQDKELLINNKPVLIKGVNRHDHCDITGRVLTKESTKSRTLFDEAT